MTMLQKGSYIWKLFYITATFFHDGKNENFGIANFKKIQKYRQFHYAKHLSTVVDWDEHVVDLFKHSADLVFS